MPDAHIRGSDPDSPHLFPLRRFGGYAMSVQADRNGYGCTPRERLDDIRHYVGVEVQISGPNGMIEVQRAGFPPEIRRFFPAAGGYLARNVPLEGVTLIEEHLRGLANAPAPPPGPSDGPALPVALTDAGLREVLLKINEALSEDTGAVNADLVAASSALLEAARERGIDFDGFEAVVDLEGHRPTY